MLTHPIKSKNTIPLKKLGKKFRGIYHSEKGFCQVNLFTKYI